MSAATTAITETGSLLAGMDSSEALAGVVVIVGVFGVAYIAREAMKLAERATTGLQQGLEDLSGAVKTSGENMAAELRSVSTNLVEVKSGQAELGRDHSEIRRDLDRETTTGSHRAGVSRR